MSKSRDRRRRAERRMEAEAMGRWIDQAGLDLAPWQREVIDSLYCPTITPDFAPNFRRRYMTGARLAPIREPGDVIPSHYLVEPRDA